VCNSHTAIRISWSVRMFVALVCRHWRQSMHSGDIYVCTDALGLIGYCIEYLVLVLAYHSWSLFLLGPDYHQFFSSNSSVDSLIAQDCFASVKHPSKHSLQCRLEFRFVCMINTSCTTSVQRCNKCEASRAYNVTSCYVFKLRQTSLLNMLLHLKAPQYHTASLGRGLRQMSLLLHCLANSAFKLSHCCRCDVQKPCDRGNDCRSSSAQPCQSRHTRSY